MSELPTGTVTFLFTEIEGSTALLKELGEGYAAVLEEHHRILRKAAEEQGGREIDNQGDSFFFAFERASGAVGAAVLAQRALSEHAWAEGVEVRVRMGLHTGEPIVGEERYLGLGVHRAARIGAVAHGGQVLLSNATRELIEDGLAGVSIRDLGSYRLKDLDRDERLYQLDVAGLRSDFPPLKAKRVAEPGTTSPPEVQIGSEFLGYRIEELIGQGGMGVVYRAYDLRLKRTVALKLVTPELALDERFRERFTRETELAMSLEHPNVVPIHDAGDVAGRLYLAMRLVVGSDLRKLVQAEGPLEPSRALSICGQVANALDAAHARALVHRDVKPSNVLLDENEHVYLADFGLTRRLEEQGAQAGEGRSLGTPAYLAPEQIEGKSVDRRADVYSLGCLLFECLTGEAPFAAGSRLAVAWAHLEEEPPSASERNADLPEAIDAVLRTAMAKEPEERYPTCDALIADAEAALGLRQRPILRPGRRLLLVAIVALVAAAAIAIAIATYGSKGTPQAKVGSAQNPITVLAPFEGTEKPPFAKVLKAFEEKTGLKTQYEISGDFMPVLRTRLPANPPMLALVPSPTILADLAREGVLKPLALLGLSDSDLSQNYSKAWLDFGAVDGKTYGLAVEASSKSVFWYRPDDFKAMGLTVPKTWAQLLSVTTKINAAGKTPWALGARDSWTLTDWFENIYIRTAGPEKYSRLFAGKLRFDHPSVIAALRRMTTILDDQYVAGGIRGALLTNFPSAVDVVFGEISSASLYMEGGFVGSTAVGNNPRLKPGRTIDAAPFPIITPSLGSPLIGGGAVIAVFVDNEAVRKLLLYLSSPEAGTVMASTGEHVSPNKRVALNAYRNAIARTEARQVAGAKVFRFDGSDLLPGSLAGSWGSTLQKVIQKPGDIPKLVKDFQRKAGREFKT
jgi:ABC-type glycerol-3-phosphate transport system substrate-binding protein/class 3 adenylate cyclase